MMLIFSLVLMVSLKSKDGFSSDVSQNARSEICQENPKIISKIRYKDYFVRVSDGGDTVCKSLDIEKNGHNVFHDEEIGSYFYLGDRWSSPGSVVFRYFDNHKRIPTLIISKWTGGAHCCFSLHLFELGETFRHVDQIYGGNSYPEFKDLDHDGIPEIILEDDFLAYEFSCFATSAMARVVLRFSDGRYHVAPEYMEKPAPKLKRYERKFEVWGKLLRKHEPDWPPPSLLQTITDLVFTGNKQMASMLIDRVWPSDVTGKKEFVKAYDDALAKSQFYPEFEKLRHK